jgi:molybdopterin synthase sulfur carrier subunit
MELELKFFATFRAAVGQKIVHREYEGDSVTVGDVLHGLESEYEGLEGNLIEDGDIRDMLTILKNGREVVHLDGLATVLEDGDTLSVFPPVAGG